jgi:hypothetical protein
MRRQLRHGAVGSAVVALLMAAPPEEWMTKTTTVAHRGRPARMLGSRRGRPRKFNRPARSVTVTLPEDVIATLEATDKDLGRAIVRIVEPSVPRADDTPVELTTFGRRAVMVVPRNRSIKQRTGAELVPLSDGRALITLGDGVSISQFELLLLDALADPSLDGDDRMLFDAIASTLRSARRADGASLHQRNIIVVDWGKVERLEAEKRADGRAKTA